MRNGKRKFNITKTTYNLLVLSETIWMFSLSVLGPVYAIFVEGISEGSLIDVGLAYTAYLFTVGIFSLPLSRLSKKYGKKKTIILGSVMYLPIPFLYPFVTNVFHVFMLQIWDGITTAISDPVWEALMADATDSKRRDRQYRIKYALTNIAAGIAAVIGGAISQLLGFKYTFFFVGILSAIATALIFLIEEHQK